MSGRFLCPLGVLMLLATPLTGQMELRVLATGLTEPLAVTQDPSNPAIQYIVLRHGQIRVLQNGVLQSQPFLNLSAKISTINERGLLGLEFAPDYAASGQFFVNYTDLDGHTNIARFNRTAGDPLIADPDSEHRILFVQQPFANHNAGTIRFGDDGYLYVPLGDGGSGNDPGNRAQDPNNLLGKILRLDVGRDDFPADPNRNYGIPADNPFLGGTPIAALPEIWAFGLRNPFKFSFDRIDRGGTGAMIVGDVGQSTREEINYEPAGAGGRNYGWRTMEGTFVTGLGPPAYTPLTDPIHEYGRDVGATVIGGYVYRGTYLGEQMQGRYFFGDFIFNRLWSIALDIDPVTGEATAFDLQEHTEQLGLAGSLVSIDIDAGGELLLTDFGGNVHQVVPEPGSILVLAAALGLLARRRK
jgi:glucose/arabinose dehydrogenase